MKSKDIILSPVGVEDVQMHIISVNDHLFNIGIELKGVVLIGASYNSINSEYRPFNAYVSKVKELFKTNKLFAATRKNILMHMKKDELIVGSDSFKSINTCGLSYAIIYYLTIKAYGYTENQFITMNSFTTIMPMISMFDELLQEKKFNPTPNELKSFVKDLYQIENLSSTVGSKLLSITRSQVEHTNDVVYPIWKALYINSMLRNIPEIQRNHFFSPSIDWGLVRCSTKHIFTNQNLLNKVKFGENVHYIRSTSEKQHKLASKLLSNRQELRDIKDLTSRLKESINDIDYDLDDLALVMFYPNMGNTLFKELMNMFDESRNSDKLSLGSLSAPLITNFDTFKQVMFQYLYCVFLLAKQGIIHNDPHLNNILLTKNETNKKFKYQMPSGEIIAFGYGAINLTLIDFDKSFLSHHHHEHFENVANTINEEMSIVFQTVKKTIVDDYDQIFNCYVMYDVVRFGLIMTQLLKNAEDNIGYLLPKSGMKQHEAFLANMVKQSTKILSMIYDQSAKFPFKKTSLYGSIEWLIVQLFDTDIKVTTRESDSSHVIKISTQMSNDIPEFVSSRRRYVDALKTDYIAQYAKNLNLS